MSIAPFVDTFFAALLVTIGWICLPPKNLRFLRYLLDIYFVTNIAILFLEYGTKSRVIAPVYDGPHSGQSHFSKIRFRQQICLACIAIANFVVSMPIKFTRECLIRLTLGFVSLLAIFTTGGRDRVSCHYSDFVRVSGDFSRATNCIRPHQSSRSRLWFFRIPCGGNLRSWCCCNWASSTRC